MNTLQAERLNAAIDRYNVEEGRGISWWDVVEEIGDMENAERVEEVIQAIEAETGSKRVIIYAKGNDPVTVLKQMEEGSEYATENRMEVVAVASTAEELEAVLERTAIDAIIVKNFSWFSEKAIHRLQAMIVLNQMGIEVHAIGE